MTRYEIEKILPSTEVRLYIRWKNGKTGESQSFYRYVRSENFLTIGEKVLIAAYELEEKLIYSIEAAGYSVTSHPFSISHSIRYYDHYALESQASGGMSSSPKSLMITAWFVITRTLRDTNYLLFKQSKTPNRQSDYLKFSNYYIEKSDIDISTGISEIVKRWREAFNYRTLIGDYGLSEQEFVKSYLAMVRYKGRSRR